MYTCCATYSHILNKQRYTISMLKDGVLFRYFCVISLKVWVVFSDVAVEVHEFLLCSGIFVFGANVSSSVIILPYGITILATFD